MDRCLKCQTKDKCDLCIETTYFNLSSKSCVDCKIPCSKC